MKNVSAKVSKDLATADRGYVLIGVLFLLTLSLVVAAGMLSSSQLNSKTRAIVNKQADYFYDAETVLHNVVGWMQLNSKSLVTGFTSGNFTTNFDLGNPVVGDNEGTNFSTPTMMKIAGTNTSVMLSNNSFFGTSAFPTTTHIDTSAPFDAVSSFSGTDFGNGANARIVGIWARDASGDYEPIFRVDVITGNNPDRGVHSFSYIYSTLEVTTPSTPGFFGANSMSTGTGNNSCSSYSYTYSGGAWSRGAAKSNCPIASNGPITLKSQINGTARTNTANGITLNGGAVSGETCTGPGCNTFTMPTLSDFPTYCPAHQGDVTVAANTSWVSSPAGATKCWQNVTVNSNRTLTLTDTTNPYYFSSLNFVGTGTLRFPTLAPGNKIKIYVGQFNSNNRINGNSLVNTNNPPSSLEIYYYGLNDYLFNGTADMNGVFYSPNANVTLNGNFNMYGAIHAKTLSALGNARFNYDEGLGVGTPVVTDMRFSIRKASQRYR